MICIHINETVGPGLGLVGVRTSTVHAPTAGIPKGTEIGYETLERPVVLVQRRPEDGRPRWGAWLHGQATLIKAHDAEEPCPFKDDKACCAGAVAR